MALGRYHLCQSVIFLLYFGVLSYVLYQSSIFLAATGVFLQSVANQKNNELPEDSNFAVSVARSNHRFHGAEYSKIEESLNLPKDFTEPLKPLLTPWAINCSESVNGSIMDRVSKDSEGRALVVVLKSRPQEFFQRQAVRMTWGAEFRGRLTFLIGRPSSPGELGDQLHSAIRLEWEHYGDILYVDFVDTYYNLSLKFLASLNYMTSLKDCQKGSFYLYGDTDALVYPDNAKEFVRKRISKGDQRTIYGLCWRGARVFRSGKWKMSQDQYISTYYPHYCAGGSFFMTGDVPRRLLGSLNLHHPYFQIDDVFFTGIIAERAMVKRQKTPGVYMLRDLNRMKDCDCLRLLATFEYQGADAMKSAWEKFQQQSKECPS